LDYLFLFRKFLKFLDLLIKGDELKLGIVILVCIDALFEAVSGALVIASNVYCGGLSSFPALSGFNYCKNIDFFQIFL